MIRFRTTDTSGTLLEGIDYYQVDPEPFTSARKKWESKGYKKKKRISDEDYVFLLNTILGEAPGEEEEVQKAVAWVILNRYNLSKDEWGGSKSLKDVCTKFKQTDLATLRFHLALGAGSNKFILYSIPIDIYDSKKDPTLGATYFKVTGSSEDEQMTIPENCRKTITIGDYQFFKDPPQQYQF